MIDTKKAYPMQAQEFYDAGQVLIAGLEETFDAATGGYYDGEPLMVHPCSDGQVKGVDDETVLDILVNTQLEPYSSAPQRAIRTTSANLYRERKGHLSAVDNPDDAAYLVVTASAVIDIAAVEKDFTALTPPVQQIMDTAKAKRQAEIEAQRQRLLQEQLRIAAQLEALDALDE